MNTNAELNMKIFSGNEYWAGSLSTSSDPAAACCTQVKRKFQNSEICINFFLDSRIIKSICQPSILWKEHKSGY